MYLKNCALAILALAVGGSMALAGEPGTNNFQDRPVKMNKLKLIEVRVETWLEADREVKALTVYGDGKVVVWRRSFRGAFTVLSKEVLAAEELELLHKFLIPRKAVRQIHSHDMIGDEPSSRSFESGGPEIIVDYLIPVRADEGGRDEPGKKDFQQPGTDSFERDAYRLPVKAEQKPSRTAAGQSSLEGGAYHLPVKAERKPRKAAAEDLEASVNRDSFKKPQQRSWSGSDEVLVRALLHKLLAAG